MSCGRQRLWRRGSDGRNLPFSSVRPLFLFAVHVSYKGKAAHASAFPWEGRNALDAAVACYNNISLLRQQLKPTWLVNGGISAFLAPGKPLFLPLAPENFFVPPPHVMCCMRRIISFTHGNLFKLRQGPHPTPGGTQTPYLTLHAPRAPTPNPAQFGISAFSVRKFSLFDSMVMQTHA